jgi:hypothetical protein
MVLLSFALGWLACNESKKEDIYVLYHVTQGGCIKDFRTAMERCRYDKHPDRRRQVRQGYGGAAQQNYGAYYTERMDKGLDQDTNPTPQEIESYRHQGKFRWWTGMRRTPS